MTNVEIIEDLTLLEVPRWWQHPAAIAGFILAAVLLGWALYRWWGQAPPVSSAPIVPAGPPPHIGALERLQALRQRRSTLGAYELAIEVSEILRDYVSARFELPLKFQTTREFLEAAAQHPTLTPEQREELGRFLGFCDLVKFAQRGASDTEQTGLLDRAESFIRLAAGLKGGTP